MKIILVPILCAMFFYYCGHGNRFRSVLYAVLSLLLYALGFFGYMIFSQNALYGHGLGLFLQVVLFLGITIYNVMDMD